MRAWRELLDRLDEAVREQPPSEDLLALSHAISKEFKELDEETARLRELAVATSKLAEIGRASSKLNHELRQPVLAIKALAEFIRDGASDPQAVAEQAILIQEQAERMARLFTTFRGGAVLPPGNEDSADIGRAARQVTALVGYRLGPRVSLDLEIPAPLPRVRVPPDTLEQILLNLVVNAIDAVEERGHPGGVVVRAVLEDALVRLYVGDEGKGVPKEVRAKLFQPYFSTKGLARGTGLGLVIVRELARAVDGCVELCDEEQVERLAPWPRPIRTAFCVTLQATRNPGE
ncbi:MAG: hypothetical protein HY698_02065 [Deltaproteobacteria bacterium]|nr:hypothetical protein [Deltaproteobacteria bacterium]